MASGRPAVPWILAVLLVGAVGFALYGLSTGPSENVPSARPQTTPAARSPSPPPSARNTGREPIPTGGLAGWRRVFADDFTASSLDLARWRVYDGAPIGDPAGWFAPTHVSASNGMLVISASRDRALGNRWATGGISSAPGLTQTYGKYLIRFRFERGIGISHAILLWPAGGQARPEVDFSEDNGSGRKRALATLHYAGGQISRPLDVDLTRWHTAGLEWTPGVLRFSFDGAVWWTVRSSAVPSVPMALTIQTQTWPCRGYWNRCPDATTPAQVRLYVDWVVAYARAASG